MSTRFSKRQSRRTRGAFTLIEILVVLAIAAIVTGITVGGFNEMRNGNKRTSCQANLVQIYQACRMYASDEGGRFPYYSADCAAPNNNDGIGLWALYTFPAANFKSPAPPSSGAPVERYVRSDKVLHCPSHIQHRSLYTDDTRTAYDELYLSYQACDDTTTAYKVPSDPPNTGVPTYQSKRTTNAGDADWPRQLLTFNGSNLVTRQPASDTVVAWCPWHRNQRDMDNVLFYDGSVQILPRVKDSLTGWQRTPKEPQ